MSKLNRKVRTLQLESLESRAMFATGVLGPVIDLSTSQFTDQDQVQTAVRPGGFTSVWQDSGLDGDEGGIYARHFNVAGVPQGDPVRINNATAGDQMVPAVAVDSSGRTFYTWGTERFISGFTYENSIQSRAFSSAGVAEGNAITRDDDSADPYAYVSSFAPTHVFFDAAGNSIAVWHVLHSDTAFFETLRVVRQSPTGETLADFEIDLLQGFRNTPANATPWTLNNAAYSLQVLPNGTILAGIEIQRQRQIIDVGPRWEHKALVQRWTRGGVPLSSISLYNASGPGEIYPNAQAFGIVNIATRGSQFAASWLNGPGNYFVRKFAGDGTPLTNAVRLLPASMQNLYNGYGFRDNTALAILPNGNYVLAWNIEIPFDYDKNFVREFLPNGTPVGAATLFDDDGYHVGLLQLDVVNATQVIASWSADDGNDVNRVYARRIGIVEPPVLGGIPATNPSSYQLNQAAIRLAAAATVTDADNANFAGGKLLVRITSGFDAGNRIEFAGTLFTVSGNNVIRKDSVNGDVILGTLNPHGGQAYAKFEITFNANAKVGYVQQLLRFLQFRTVNGFYTDERKIEFSLTDGSGGVSNKVVQTISVVP